MADNTKISWADASWPVTTGCAPVSPGCDNCYAAVQTGTRLAHLPEYAGLATREGRFTGEVRLHPHRLDKPLRWTRPRRIFVCSMSDLFHEDVPDAFIGAVFDIMARAKRHTFQVLTKRHGRLRSLLNRWAAEGITLDGGYERAPHRSIGPVRLTAPVWTPPPNVWIGVSVDDQKWADIRIPALLDTPAAVRWLSCEPLLGPVDLSAWMPPRPRWGPEYPEPTSPTGVPVQDLVVPPSLDWVVVGGESGKEVDRPIARMDLDWALSIWDQCRTSGAAFHFKQLGTLLAREMGIPGKGADPARWPEPWPQDYPAVAHVG